MSDMPCGLAGATAARIKASVTQANAAVRARRMANAHNPRGSRLDMPLARLRQWSTLHVIVALVPLAAL